MGGFVVAACGGLAIFGGAAMAQSTAEENTRAAEEVCLPAVAERSGSSDVVVIRSEFDEMFTSVTVGAGPERTPYRCVVKKNGSEEFIESIIKE